MSSLRQVAGRLFLMFAIAAASTGAAIFEASPADALSFKKVKRKVKSEFNEVFKPDRSRGRREQRQAEPAPAGAPSLPDAPRNPRAVKNDMMTVRPIVSGVSQKRHMILWGRHSPKFVKSGSNRYVVLLGDDLVPVVYGRADGPEGTWRAVFRSKSRSHQPPTLLADGAGQLHLLFVNEQGYLRHGIFAAGRRGTLDYQGEPSTKRWGDSNYYLGAAYMRASGAIILCASNSKTRAFRCSTTEGGKWRRPHIIANGISGTYLYPNIEPTGNTALVASGLYRAGTPHAMRVLNNLFTVGPGGQLIRDGRAVTYGNEASGRTYFESDIAKDGKGHAGHLVTPTAHRIGIAVPSNLYLLRGQDKFSRRLPVGGLTGYSFTLVSDGNAYHVFGGGYRAVSNDGGVTWESEDLELPGYPKSRFTYGVAQALQERSGSAAEHGKVSFLQELVDRQRQKNFVVEVNLALPDAIAASKEPPQHKDNRRRLR